ncbi:MAG TPA: hypothetical protein VK508_17980 [Cyclobacteriaceae bacterium]|nr:hypothetical protein [Cyclobacteriaceae bacterium]
MIDPIDSSSGSGSGLSVTSQGASYLKETGGWAKFLSILGFCFVGLMVIVALFLGTVMSTIGMEQQIAGFQVLVTVVYLLFAALYFFPILYLFRFATKVTAAVKSNDTVGLTSALENLKSHYKFIGLLTAIIVGLYGVILVIALVIGVAM